MSKPITPREVAKAKVDKIPPYIIQVFNDMIVKHWNGSYSCFKQDDVMVEAVRHYQAQYPSVKAEQARSTIFANHWLDVEPIFEGAGWSVEYDKPGYNESYPATFTFRVRTR